MTANFKPRVIPDVPDWIGKWILNVTTILLLMGDLFFTPVYPLTLLYYPLIAAICWQSHYPLACGYIALYLLVNVVGDFTASNGVNLQLLWTHLETCVVLILFTFVVNLLKQSQSRMRRASQVDGLTGLENSTSFLSHAAQELNRAKRKQSPITVIFLDCDDFKQVNDEFGHLTGDQLLCNIAEVLVQQTRSYDVVARWGGDEFAVLLPETDSPQAHIVAQRLQSCLKQRFDEHNWNSTFSIGVVTFRELPETEKALVHRADEAMYYAKKQGKNLIYFTSFNEPQLPETSALPMLDSRQNA